MNQSFMKRLLSILMLMTCLWSIAQAQYQVNYLSNTGETMTLRAVGYGKNAMTASTDAELSVIKALMFHGIPDTQQSTPMVSRNETETMKENKKFLTKFFEGEYQNIITRSVIVHKFGKNGIKKKNITLDVTVNIRALRTELERNGVIRKFGF